MTPARFTKPRIVARAPWPDVFHAISGLIRVHGLPIPVEVVRSAPRRVGVRLESNADAAQWMRRLDPGKSGTSGPEGELRARCDWMGWEVTIRGAPQPPTLPKGVLSLGRADTDDARRGPAAPWAEAA
jgi:hypothetical protein